MLQSLPAFTRHYGIRPWELEQFTLDELNTYLRAMDEHFRALEMNARRQQRNQPKRRR